MAYALSEHNRFPEFADRIVDATNEKFDLCISGYVHVLEFEQTGIGISTSFPVIFGSHSSNRLEAGRREAGRIQRHSDRMCERQDHGSVPQRKRRSIEYHCCELIIPKKSGRRTDSKMTLLGAPNIL